MGGQAKPLILLRYFQHMFLIIRKDANVTFCSSDPLKMKLG